MRIFLKQEKISENFKKFNFFFISKISKKNWKIAEKERAKGKAITEISLILLMCKKEIIALWKKLEKLKSQTKK